MGKKQTKPLFELKDDFKDSLDAMSWAAINLIQGVEAIVEQKMLPKLPNAELAKRCAAFKATLTRDE